MRLYLTTTRTAWSATLIIYTPGARLTSVVPGARVRVSAFCPVTVNTLSTAVSAVVTLTPPATVVTLDSVLPTVRMLVAGALTSIMSEGEEATASLRLP